MSPQYSGQHMPFQSSRPSTPSWLRTYHYEDSRFDALAQQVNVIDLIRHMAGFGKGDIGPAMEVSAELARRSGRNPNGIYLSHASLAKRALEVSPTNGSTGGKLVATDLRGFIDMLRPRSKVISAGARMLTGLIGNVSIPRSTSGCTAYWVEESEAPLPSQPSIDQVSMTPKTVASFVEISRRMLLQSSINVIDFVSSDLTSAIALAVDAAAINGLGGVSGQPLGILNTVGINSQTISGAVPTWEEIVGMETAIAADDVATDTCSLITTPEVRSRLKQILKVPTDGDSGFLWETAQIPRTDGSVNGYGAFVSNNLPKDLGTSNDEHPMIFGNWSDLLIGMWGSVDLIVDPYTQGDKGAVRVYVHQDVDTAVRHPESFIKAQFSPL